MNKAEFCKATGEKYETLTEEVFDRINTVYAFHPMISNVHGKKEIADLWKLGGLGIINDMYTTADEVRLHESNIQANNVALENLRADNKKELDRLKERQFAAERDIVNDNIAADDRLREINRTFNK